MSVKSRTLYITIAITVAALFYYIADEWYQYSMNVELLHREQVSIIENYYNNFPKRTLQMMRNNAGFIRQDGQIMTAFKNRDREALAGLVERYYKYGRSVFSNSDMVFNFVLPDGTVFYRAHNPEAFGDNIMWRKMIEQAITTRKPVTGTEMGRSGLFCRHVQPVGEMGQMIGIIEVGVHISFFAGRIENLAGIKTILMLDSAYAGHSDEKLDTVGAYTEYFNNTGLAFASFIKDFRQTTGVSYVNLGDKSFEVIKEFTLEDFQGNKIGDYVFFAERSILHAWFKRHILFTSVIALFSIVLLIFIIRNGFIKSIEELEKAHGEIMRELVVTNAGLEERIKDEIEQSRQKDQIINQQQKVADMGQMLSAVSHHWRQPINAIGLYVQDLLDAHKSGELDEDYIKEFEKNNMKLLTELSRSIDTFSSYYRPSRAPEVFYVSDVVCDISGILRSNLQAEGIELLVGANCGEMVFDYKRMDDIDVCRCEDSAVKGPLSEFRQSILNIFFNAVDSLKEKYKAHDNRSVIKVFIGSEDGQVIFRISDNGIGIPENVLDKIFNPFFTTKDVGKDTGLGLYMAKTIIERHMGGKLTVSSGSGETVFEVSLPKAKK